MNEWKRRPDLPGPRAVQEDGAPGLLGITKPDGFGGLGLDYSYSVAFAEDLGRIELLRASPWPSAFRPTWRRPPWRAFGSDELREEFLAPAIAGDCVTSIGVSRARRRLRRRLDQDHRQEGRRRLRHQRQQDVDHQRHCRPTGCACWPTPPTARRTRTSR